MLQVRVSIDYRGAGRGGGLTLLKDLKLHTCRWGEQELKLQNPHKANVQASWKRDVQKNWNIIFSSLRISKQNYNFFQSIKYPRLVCMLIQSRIWTFYFIVFHLLFHLCCWLSCQNKVKAVLHLYSSRPLREQKLKFHKGCFDFFHIHCKCIWNISLVVISISRSAVLIVMLLSVSVGIIIWKFPTFMSITEIRWSELNLSQDVWEGFPGCLRVILANSLNAK